MTILIISEMNKINFKVLISILLVAFSFIACGGDDKNEDEVTKTNHFLYEGKEYPLNDGLFTFYGRSSSSNEGFNIALDLYSSGIKPDSNNNNISGKGELMGFRFFSSAENELSSGTYIFNSNGVESKVFTFTIGVTYINVDTEKRGGGEDAIELFATGGSVKVNKTGKIYELDIDFTLDNGKKLTAYYKGEIKEPK
jgi:hypothetical protein